MSNVIPLPERPAASPRGGGTQRPSASGDAPPWTKQKVQAALGYRLAGKMTDPQLADIAEDIEHCRELMRWSAEKTGGDVRMSREALDHLVLAGKAFREGRALLRTALRLANNQELSAELDPLLAELGRVFPEAPDEGVTSKGGAPESILKSLAPMHAMWVRRALREAQVELSDKDRQEVVTAIVARWIDDSSPGGTYGNGRNTKRLVKAALAEWGFFDQHK